jgi:hypothetical protein
MSRFRIQSNIVYWGYHKIVRHSRSTVCEESSQTIRKRESAVRTSNSDEGKEEERKPACEGLEYEHNGSDQKL